MVIIRGGLTLDAGDFSPVRLFVERATLSKRRWRGVAEDGREFGFDLEKQLGDGAVFFREGESVYAISQKAEAVLQIWLGDAKDAARAGWMIGNLHFPIEVSEGAAFTVEDAAVLALFEREGIPFERVERVFRPVSAVTHGHHH